MVLEEENNPFVYEDSSESSIEMSSYIQDPLSSPEDFQSMHIVDAGSSTESLDEEDPRNLLDDPLHVKEPLYLSDSSVNKIRQLQGSSPALSFLQSETSADMSNQEALEKRVNDALQRIGALELKLESLLSSSTNQIPPNGFSLSVQQLPETPSTSMLNHPSFSSQFVTFRRNYIQTPLDTTTSRILENSSRFVENSSKFVDTVRQRATEYHRTRMSSTWYIALSLLNVNIICSYFFFYYRLVFGDHYRSLFYLAFGQVSLWEKKSSFWISREENCLNDGTI